MRWMEVIGVRAAAGNRDLLETRLRKMIAEMKAGGAAPSITLLHRLSIASDLCVHLAHDSEAADPAGSRLGLILAMEMKAFGLVHHSIWTEPADV